MPGKSFDIDLCNIAANGKSKFTAFELRAAYNDLEAVATNEMYPVSTVDFGFYITKAK